MGAIAPGGLRVLNHEVVRALGIPDHAIDVVAAKEQQELTRRERLYRGDRPPLDVRGKTVILVDDGLATGATMLAAIKALRQQQAGRIVVAVPIAAPETCDQMRGHADDIICGYARAPTPSDFGTRILHKVVMKRKPKGDMSFPTMISTRFTVTR
jgi:predicted phosphoribosyltransferase